MSTKPTDEADLASELREVFERCECGLYVPTHRAEKHRSACYVAGGITPLDQTTESERDWRRRADDRPYSTTVYVVDSPARDVVAYHERGGCHVVDGGDVEATTLIEAKRRDCAPCSRPACRRARGDLVYGDLYEPLDADGVETDDEHRRDP